VPDKPRALTPVVDIPRPADDRPAWSRVGIVGAVGFVVGIAWPRIAGFQVGPSVPGDTKAAAEAASSGGQAVVPPVPSAAPSAAPAAAALNRQLVVVSAGEVVKCSDKKNKKVAECDKLDFDGIAKPKLEQLASCPAALGLEGRVVLGLDVDFEKREVSIVKGKKSSLPNSTLQGLMKCAANELGSAALEKVAHEQRKYTLHYPLAFYPPGKHPDADAPGKADADGDEAAKKGDDKKGEQEATGSATVSWDTALLRKEPRDGEVAARIVRGTKVKIVARQGDWYKVEHGSKTGWVYRGAIGM
jgi:hypothetical protein